MSLKATQRLQAILAKKLKSTYNPFDDHNWVEYQERYNGVDLVLKFCHSVLELDSLAILVDDLKTEDDFNTVIIHHLLNNVCSATISNFRTFYEAILGIYPNSKFYYANAEYILLRVQ